MNKATVEYLVVGKDSVGYIVSALIQSGLVEKVAVTYSVNWRDGNEEASVGWVDRYGGRHTATSGQAIVFIGKNIVKTPARNLEGGKQNGS